MFAGDIGSLVGRAAVATVRVETDAELLVIGPEGMRTLVVMETELSEIFMRASFFGASRSLSTLFSGSHEEASTRERDHEGIPKYGIVSLGFA
ncbi:hypothetical protein D3C72_1973430 [compost metagenome]